MIHCKMLLVKVNSTILVLYDILQALKTPSEQIERLLADVLPKRPPQAVVLFAKGLIETDQTYHLQKIGILKDDLNFIRNFKGKGVAFVKTSVMKGNDQMRSSLALVIDRPGVLSKCVFVD